MSRLESVVYPLFAEPTHMVVFDIAFKRETYFDGSFGVLVKVEFISNYYFLSFNFCRENKGKTRQSCEYVFTF